jgi:hypothetical protein
MEPQRTNPNLGMPPTLPTAQATMAAVSPQAAPYQQPTNNVRAGGAPVVAEDSDIIEQEWVAAVKRTLEQFRDDPYSLSRAMTALRQDYLQKRYGRTVEAAK